VDDLRGSKRKRAQQGQKDLLGSPRSIALDVGQCGDRISLVGEERFRRWLGKILGFLVDRDCSHAVASQRHLEKSAQALDNVVHAGLGTEFDGENRARRSAHCLGD
jgi:hypothetical protein